MTTLLIPGSSTLPNEFQFVVLVSHLRPKTEELLYSNRE